MEPQHQLNLLKAYVDNHPGAIDLCFVEDLNEFPFDWDQTVMKHLYLFAKTGTGSYIGYWWPDDVSVVPTSDLPLVWIDHEGTPMSVFAQSTIDFLALLHFDTGLIYEFLIDSYFYNTDSSSYQNPLKKFNKRYITKYVRGIEKDKSPYFKDFREWLFKTFRVAAPDDPAALIQKAITNQDNFSGWLKTVL